MSIVEYEDLTEMVLNYLNANDMGNVANSITQEIKCKHRLKQPSMSRRNIRHILKELIYLD